MKHTCEWDTENIGALISKVSVLPGWRHISRPGEVTIGVHRKVVTSSVDYYAVSVQKQIYIECNNLPPPR
jgi:hypothetical protein